VQVFLAAARDELSGDAEANLERLEAAGSSADVVSDPGPVSQACPAAALVVDALLGTGLTGKVRGLPGQLIEAVNECAVRVLAVDVPSGLDADTGEPLGLAIRAVETVTMGLPKLGLFLYPGTDYAGRVTVAEIGFPADLLDEAPSVADLIDPEWVRMLLPRREPSAHKGRFGRVLAIAGSAGMTGAACLCAQGALRAGAGLVTVGGPASINDILEVKLTEAMTVPLPETYGRTLDTRALALILELAEDADVLAIGPGLSREPETAVLVRRLVARVEKPIVVAALILEGAHAPAVLTPHPGEMARLMGVAAEKVQSRRAHFAEAAAKRFDATIVLKGARSIIAHAGRPLTINPTGNPGMATGGTGDVLTGMVAALIAQGLLPFEAAAAATYLHGLAGDIAASRLGEASMVAGDVLAAVPEAVRRVAEGNREERRWKPAL
jgi:NAD(P)H-hydrate epimerase